MDTSALPGGRLTPHHDEGRLRRLAMQIATQLPENNGEARTVLRYTQELVDNFLTPQGAVAVKNPTLRVVKPAAS